MHDPGKIIADLAVTLALGGDCLADIAALRAEPALFGPVASDPVVSRLITQLAADAPRALRAIRAARAAARGRAWALAGASAPGADGGLVTVDIDATIVTACSEKEQARPTWRKTFGFHPLTVFADHGPDGAGEPLAIVLRPGNAGSNTAADHIEATRLALAQLPRDMRRRVLIRADSGGGTHDFLDWLTRPGRRLQYSVGMTITADIHDAILKLPARAWTPAYDADRKVRDGAWASAGRARAGCEHRADLPAAAAAELSEQLRAHLLEALPPDADEDTVMAVLAALGPGRLVAEAAAGPAPGRQQARTWLAVAAVTTTIGLPAGTLIFWHAQPGLQRCCFM